MCSSDLFNISFIVSQSRYERPKDLEKIIKLKEEYWEKIKEILKNENILEIVAECIESMLERINVPDEEINEMIEMLEKGKVNNMFTFAVNYDYICPIRFRRRVCIDK